MTRHRHYEAVVVGGGFFGCSLAVALAEQGHRVLLCEERSDLLERASHHNQARVHRGYHYPRSVLTALRSRINFPRWVADYRECIVADFDQYYAIGRRFSKVSARQFAGLMGRLGAPLGPAPAKLEKLFNPALIEEVFTVREQAFDAVKLRSLMRRRLEQTAVETVLGTRATRVREGGGGLELSLEHGGEKTTVAATHVFNCTYSQLNSLLSVSGLPRLRLKHELAELALVEVPESLRKCGLTVMCGPFFSLFPFPARGLHTLSHVRYTPHGAWEDTGASFRGQDDFLAGRRPPSNFPLMRADARRYLPMMAECRQVRSLWEVKTVLPQSEEDDSRPILFRRDCGLKNLHCVLGAKIDNIFDVLAECAQFA